MNDGEPLDVVLGTPEDKAHNVVVLTGYDIEVPIEADLDDNPLQDDELRMTGRDGSERILTVRDPDVRLDVRRKLYLYRFRLVPPGSYTIALRNTDRDWATVATGVQVGKRGVLFGGAKLEDKPAPAIPPEPPAPEPTPAPDLEFVPQPVDKRLVILEDENAW